MEAIKFKLYDTKNRKWVHAFDVIEYDNEKILYTELLEGTNAEDVFCVFNDVLSHIKIVRWTGKKDSDGHDMYEGSILQHDDGNVVIIWDNRLSSYECLFNDSNSIGLWEIDNPTIIGNIFDNPELVSKEQREWI